MVRYASMCIKNAFM